MAKKKQPKAKELETERQTGKKNKYAYKITDKFFPDFWVLNTANAWWLEKAKVMNVIAAYKIDATDAQAAALAGISVDQIKYFKKLHKDFFAIKLACRQVTGLKAKKTVSERVGDSYSNAVDYLERKEKGEWSKRTELTGEDGEPLFNIGKVTKEKLKELE